MIVSLIYMDDVTERITPKKGYAQGAALCVPPGSPLRIPFFRGLLCLAGITR